MLDALLWWLALFILGVAALPITVTLFRNLPDRGYAFSRPLGLVVVCYLFWLLGTARVLPNSPLGVVIAFLVLLAISALVLRKRRAAVIEFLRHRWGVVLATEAVFLGLFIAWAVIRSHTPAIAHTEQPMDLAMLNGIRASPHFPPNDPWSAGLSISYYYFGYLMAAALATVTGITSGVAYNLNLASTAAMAGVGVLSVVYNLVRGLQGGRYRLSKAVGAILVGLLAVMLLLFIGNLVGALEFGRANAIGSPGFYQWVGIDGLKAGPSPTWYPSDTWWWWRSTRVINTFMGGAGVDYTITEFPFFSFLLGDMHPHVMALPFTITAVALSYNVLRSKSPPSMRWLRANGWQVLLAALLLGSLGFLNSWDLPTFMALFLAALLVRAFHARARGQEVRLKSVALLILVIAAGAVILYAPFYRDLSSQANGILPVRREMSRPIHFFLVWGPFLLLTLPMLAALSWDNFRRPAVNALRRVTRAPNPLTPLPFRGGGTGGETPHPNLLPQGEKGSDGGPGADVGLGGRRGGPEWPPSGEEEGAHAGAPLRADTTSQPLQQTQLASPLHRPDGEGLGVRWWRSPILWAAGLPLVPFALWALVELAMGAAGDSRLLRPGVSNSVADSALAIGSRFWHLVPFFVVLALALGLVFHYVGKERGRPGVIPFVVLLVLFGALLTLGAELFHIADFFGNRMNTIFKFYYQAWVMLAIASAVGVYFWATRPERSWLARNVAMPALIGLFAVAVVAAFLYVLPAIYDKTNHFHEPVTLDGLAPRNAANPEETEAVQWLMDNAPRGSVVVEGLPGANGSPAGDYDSAVGRISQATGMPTILGWPGHEHQWRGDPFDPIQERFRDLEAIYRDPDRQKAQRLLGKYGATYVVVGELERRAYGVDVAERFKGFMAIAFQSSGVVLYTRQPA